MVEFKAVLATYLKELNFWCDGIFQELQCPHYTKSGFEDFSKFSDISDRGINICSPKKEDLEIFAPKYGG